MFGGFFSETFKPQKRLTRRRYGERTQEQSSKKSPVQRREEQRLVKEARTPRIRVNVSELINKQGEFLVDSGVSVNLIPLDSLDDKTKITSREEITGLSPSSIRTMATTVLRINGIPAHFYVINRLPMSADGLIGIPLLLQERADTRSQPIMPTQFTNFPQVEESASLPKQITGHRIPGRTMRRLR